jgi:hypothetical protein
MTRERPDQRREFVEGRPSRLRRVDGRHHVRIEFVGVEVDPETAQNGPSEAVGGTTARSAAVEGSSGAT